MDAVEEETLNKVGRGRAKTVEPHFSIAPKYEDPLQGSVIMEIHLDVGQLQRYNAQAKHPMTERDAIEHLLTYCLNHGESVFPQSALRPVLLHKEVVLGISPQISLPLHIPYDELKILVQISAEKNDRSRLERWAQRNGFVITKTDHLYMPRKEYASVHDTTLP